MASKWFTLGQYIILSIALTLQVCRSVTASNHSKEFKLNMSCKQQRDCDKIVSVVQSTENDYIYLATKFTLKKLDNNLNPILDRTMQVYGSNTEPNFILLRGSDLILCLKDDDGTCELWDAFSLNKTMEGYNTTMVINPEESSTVAWVAKGDINGSDFVNIAISRTFHSSAVPRIIPLVSTRILPQRNEPQFKFLSYLEDNFGSPKSFLPPTPCLTTEIEPVYGFSTSRFNYFLKRHTNENGRIETRLSRTCKHSSTFRSFIELPLECHKDNSDPTDRKLSSAYFINDQLYAVFTTTSQNELESIVCRYHINKINQQFTERRKECLLGITVTTELEWYQYNTCPSKPVPSSKFNISQLDDPDFCYDLDTAYPLGGRKPILEEPLGNLTMKEFITAILVVPTPDGEVYLLGDNAGYIHKISSMRGIEVKHFDLGSAMLPQNGLILSNDNATVYATSSEKIVAISLTETWTTQAPTMEVHASTGKPDDPDDDENFSILTQAWAPFTWIVAISVVVIIR
ncbi:Plexin-A4 [Holothuria leucospilota]|uniref:Plexin-A4 n=1 Tax=Holothuria leucospilota TaxID=206669 RepID=A0A9Q1BSV9_HOLLE|nr:Plexin-A4 [Holothuria leucospilota]